MADDATYDDATYDEQTQVDYIRGKGHGILSKMFSSCAEDPQGSVHRAWGITLLFIVIFFIMAFVEGKSMQARLVWWHHGGDFRFVGCFSGGGSWWFHIRAVPAVSFYRQTLFLAHVVPQFYSNASC